MNLFSQHIDFGFSAGDLVTNAGALVQSIAPYLLLALAFIPAYYLVNLIRNAISGREADEADSYWKWQGVDDDGIWWYENGAGERVKRGEMKRRAWAYEEETGETPYIDED